MVRGVLAGVVLVMYAVAGRIFWRHFSVPSFVLFWSYIIGSLLISRYFVEGPPRRLWIGAPIMFLLVCIPRAITWWMFR